jgi:hypothetical protein
VKKGSLEVNKGKIDKNVGICNRQHGLIVAHILLQMVLHFLKYISKKKDDSMGKISAGFRPGEEL